MVLIPSSIGFQDLGALLARQPGVAARARTHVIASPFGTIHAATFSMPSPLGTAIPHPPLYALANFDPNDLTGSITRQFLGDPNAPLQFPTVNRTAKRDSLLSRAREPVRPLPPALTIDPLPKAEVSEPVKKEEVAGRFDPYTEYEFATVPEEQLTAPDIARLPNESAAQEQAAKNGDRIFFGANPLGAEEQITPYATGEAPIVLASREEDDPDIKMSALEPPKAAEEKSGESYAAKGEVTGVDQRPKSPAERLGLTGANRAKQEKCLANAVYFEARGEAVRGQIAVAQVVLNRVFTPFYPKTVCDVVYQNAHRRYACQFTFACDGIPDVVTEPDAYARAQRIARDMLDGKLWMPEVSKATHYHAYWVHPDWVNEMKKIYKLGVHTFYRPLNWGNGEDEPTWGDAKVSALMTAQEEQMGPPSYSLQWLRSDDGKAYARQTGRQ
jgi:spore germination cell wall hydrolase CwlJ-like protein